ncbi:MAG: dihydropteroate synthase [Elusimicrobiaceae bacterium]|nr:dihydropteroate synthase [Elusimicrobiaceae bacterium]
MQKITLMGILNTSPESFFDGEKVEISQKYVLEKAQNLINEGAEIIDIGGQSTRPGYTEISPEEEIARTAPFIKLIRQNIKTQISVDSYKFPVVKKALEEGADIINDISGLKDENLAKLAAKYKAKLVLMHNGAVQNLESVAEFFQEKIKRAALLGVSRENLILDIGLGFGKTTEENWFLLENISYFDKFNLPLLVGASRKRFTGKTLENSIKAAKLSMQTKAQLLLRVHEVKETKKGLNL